MTVLCVIAICTNLIVACRFHSTSVGPDNKTVSFSPLPTVSQQSDVNAHAGQAMAQISSPIVYVYKTKKDYSHLVPVLMDETRTRIVSYPAPADLLRNGRPTLPTLLEGGFWLDNRGIGPTVAFLSYTYEEYSQFTHAPSYEELMGHIIDKYPLTSLRACGRRADYKDIVTELNEKIRTESWK